MASLTRGLQLLAAAVRYALAGAGLVTPPSLSRPTPCAEWDLKLLVDHVSDSAGVLHQAITAGCAGLPPPPGDGPPGLDPVHGWDISVACGARRPVPPGLAAILLPLAPLLISPATRPGLFADPVPVPAWASPGDQLVAFLGRQPQAPPGGRAW